MNWDVFCRVIDNHGDIGVCWRLSADLAARGEKVRLWIDDPSALSWMAPAGVAGVTVFPWPQDPTADRDSFSIAPGDVVVEAFGCQLPHAIMQGMARASRSPVWINLEYLSAERFVERAHKLASPQPIAGPAGCLRKWFFYPGFTALTGGLIRERDLIERQQAFDARAWLAGIDVRADQGEQVVSLFCYEQPALAAMIDQWSRQPTVLLATVGHASDQVRALLGPTLRRGALRAVLLPALAQNDYDHLLWASDINFVRGEDSFVRAQWAAKPFVWQIYPQDDGVHLAKLDAFLVRFLSGAGDGLVGEVSSVWRTWNASGTSASPAAPLPALQPSRAWAQYCEAWRSSLAAQADLTTQLLRFVAETS